MFYNMRAIKPILVLLLVVAAGAAAYVYLNRPPTALTLTGIVTTNDVVVSPQIGGRLEKLTVSEGDIVKRDQLLAIIAPAELKAESSYALANAQGLSSQVQEAEAALRFEQRHTIEQIRQAESTLASVEAQQAAAVADLENARLIFDRTQNLSKQGVSPASQLDESRTAFQAAQARADALKKQVDAQRAMVDMARASAEQVSLKRSQVKSNEHMQAAAAAQRDKADVRLAYSEIRAPIDGIVDVRAARAGEVVNPGQPVVTLINPDDLWVRADVEESYIDKVKLGDHLKVRLPSDAELDCVVIYRGVDAQFATQRDVSRTKRDIKTFEVRLRCDNTDRRLAVGMTAYVDLRLR
jgi:HlyD family secretion protein